MKDGSAAQAPGNKFTFFESVNENTVLEIIQNYENIKERHFPFTVLDSMFYSKLKMTQFFLFFKRNNVCDYK